MAGGYWDVHSLLAEQTAVPGTSKQGATGLGRLLDPAGDQRDLARGTHLDLPLWLLQALAQRNMAVARTPAWYGAKMRLKLDAAKHESVRLGAEDLRSRCPYFYQVAAGLLPLLLHSPAAIPAGELAALANETFRTRYRQLLMRAHSADSSHETALLQAHLSTEEARLFDAGRTAMAAFERWRYSSSGVPRVCGPTFNSRKRRMDTTSSAAVMQQQQRQQAAAGSLAARA